MADADYQDLEHTGPGTLAGRYLRSFWQPVARARDLEPGRAIPVRLMGEDFTLYRGETGPRPHPGSELAQLPPLPAGEGTGSVASPAGRGRRGAPGEGGPPTPIAAEPGEGVAHLVAFRCAHRGTQLSVGWVEGDCIRCRYHGWRYGPDGQCVEQPGEDPGAAERVRIRAYPTQEYLGLIFAYLGDGDPPPFRRFPDFDQPGILEAGPPEIWPCNYFNRIDNDPGHVPFTHRESTRRTSGSDQFKLRTVTARETEYGVMSTSTAPGRPEFYIHFHMPNINQTRSVIRVEGSIEDARKLWVDRLFWRLPIDDENCISYVVDLVHLTGAEAEAYLKRRRLAEAAEGPSPNEVAELIMAGKMRVEDVDLDTSMYKLFWIEDYITQVSQGPRGDRPPDRLGKIDQTVILKRKIWERELKALAEGRPLKEWTEPAELADMSAVGG